MIAADIMTENVRFISPDETIADAVELLQSLEVRHLPVVDENDQLVGMLSDRDLRALFVPFDEDGETAGSMLKQGRMSVSKVMSSNVVAVNSEDSVDEVVDRLLEDKLGALPVVDSEDKLVGIISVVDVLRHWRDERDASPAPKAPARRLSTAPIKVEPAKEKGRDKASSKKAVAKKAPSKKAVAKKAVAKKAVVGKASKKPVVKASTKKAVAKKAPSKKPVAKKANKASSRKKARR